MRKVVATLALLCVFAFAQSEQKIAVYITGNLGANEKEALSKKMLSSFVGSGRYKAIEKNESFFNGLQEYEKTNALEDGQIIDFGRQLGAQFVCIVNIKPAFDSYHLYARIIDTGTWGVVIIGEAGSALKSLDDLTNVTNALNVQLLPQQVATNITTPATALAAPATAPPVPQQQQCNRRYNINEIIFQIKEGFPTQLQGCGTSLAKDIALSKSPFSKTPAPEPKSYMTQCTMDGIKTSLPADFPGVDKVIEDTQKFLQTVLNTALTGGTPNPASLMSAASDMSSLLNGIKNLSKDNPCIVDKPYTPPVASVDEDEEDDDSEGESGTSIGLRWGMYFEKSGWLLGLVIDKPLSNWFHFQSGIIYMQKEYLYRERYYNDYRENRETDAKIKIPLYFSLKLAAFFRINAGPHFNICLNSHDDVAGFSGGLGFDIWKLYTGVFMDSEFNAIGLNAGINF